MKLKAARPATVFQPLRGLGKDSVPHTGVQALPSARFWGKEELLANGNAHYAPGDIFLGRVDQTMIGLRDNRHILTIAGSRSGKSACVLIPNLMLYPGSVMVIDPKGELATATARHRAETMGQEVFVLDPFGVAEGDAETYRANHNPLAELSAPQSDAAWERLIDDAALFAEALITDSGRGDDHWTIAARNLVMGLILMAVCERRPDMASLRHHLLQSGEGLEKLFRYMAGFSEAAINLDPSSVVAIACAIVSRTGAFMLGRDERERSSVIATAIEQLAFLESPAMASLFNGHDVSIADLKRPSGEKPVTIYLVLPAGYIGTHYRWLRLMIALGLGFFERNTAKPDHPVLLILEEFAALGYLRPVEQAAGFIAGADVRLWSVLQDLPQLRRHYKDGWETFIGNAGTIHAFSVSDQMTCDFLSKRMGDTTIQVENAQHVTSEAGRLGDTGIRYENRTVPLMPPAEVAMMFRRQSEHGEARGGLSLVLVPGTAPFVVDRVFHGELEA